MKPILHAQNSAKKFGGVAADYVAIHDYMDYSKAFHADVRHRIAMHHSVGCWMVEDKFGHLMTNSAGKQFSPRDVAEQHCMEDHGTILSFKRWLSALGQKPPEWSNGLNDQGRSEFFKVLHRPVDFVPDSMYAKILLLNDYGIWLVRDSLGDSQADLATEWIYNLAGYIPAFEDTARLMVVQPWMGPPRSRSLKV